MIDFNNLPAQSKIYYQDDAAVIYCADNRSILPLFPDKSFDLVLTDPPYGIAVGDNQSSRETRCGLMIKKKYIEYNDTPENYRDIVVPAIQSALSISTRGAVFGFPPNIFLLPPPSVIGGLFVPAGCGRNRWGWTNFMPVLFYGCAPELNKGANQTSIRATASGEKVGHPTPKPLDWLKWLVSLASLEGELILDPFLGSGTTAVAAKILGRKCVGIEISEKYCEIAAKRLSQSVMQLEIPKETIEQSKF